MQILQQCVQEQVRRSRREFVTFADYFCQLQKIGAFGLNLQQIAGRIVASGCLAKIAAEWRMPMEIACDLVRLALFDIVLLCDDSGSMSFEENGSRIGTY